ncbi:MAG: alanine racemase [bacterium]
MTRNSRSFVARMAGLFSPRLPQLDDAVVKRLVVSCLERRGRFLECAQVHGSPLYVIDTEALRLKGQKFLRAFSERLPNFQAYYAMKSNSHPRLAATLVEVGLGLDVSSGVELKAALASEARRLVFSGPGKTADELTLAVQNAERVTVLIDSLAELHKLDQQAALGGVKVRAGVRLTTDDHGLWRKFGIPLDSLSSFFEAADNCRNIRLCGLQFHLSWNMNADPHVRFLAKLGKRLNQMTADRRRSIEFLDIGGGFWPAEGEWLQAAATPRGMLQTALDNSPGKYNERFHRPAAAIEEFALYISNAIKKYIPADMSPAVYAEPGRWLCQEAMHILVRVVDRKADDIVITDGGTNAVGWERFESDFFPVVNLSRPSTSEQKCLVAGSLCTPHDIWGYSYFGDDIRPGDTLLIPCQGAYTYSLRQEFIKPLPNCAEIPRTKSESVETPSEPIACRPK